MARLRTMLLILTLPLALPSRAEPAGRRPTRANRLTLAQVGIALRSRGAVALVKAIDRLSQRRSPTGALQRGLATRRALESMRSPYLWATHTLAQNQPGSRLLNLLAPLADRRGRLDLDRVEATLGREGRQLVERIAKVPVDEQSLAGSSFRGLIANLTPLALRHLVAELKPRQHMPVFDRLADRQGPLRDARLFMANAHFLVDTEQLFGKLVGKSVPGRQRVKVAAWAKEHSTDPLVAASLFLGGAAVREVPVGRDVKAVLAQARAYLRSVEHPETIRKPQLILFDDGGELIRAVAGLVRREFPRHAHLVAAAENTTRGIKRLERLEASGKLPFVVVDIARSWAKRVYGSPMLGYSVYKQTAAQLAALARQGVRPVKKQLVVMGYGAMGQAIAAAFRDNTDYEILIFDRDPRALKRAHKDGFATEPNRRKALAQGHLLISAVGGTTLTARTVGKLPDGAIVVNAASPREFSFNVVEPLVDLDSRNHQYGRFQGRRVDLGEVAEGGQLHAVVESGGKRALFLKSGLVVNFPLNFVPDRSRPIPGRYIQLPIGLMSLGIQQAARGGPARIQKLALKPQKELVAEVERALGERRTGRQRRPESLLSPHW